MIRFGPIDRNRRTGLSLAAALIIAPAPSASVHAEPPFRLDVELGAAWQTRSTFAVPGEGGTRVDLDDFVATFAARATLVWDFGELWSARLVAAPLSAETEFVPDAAVDFGGTRFPAAAALTQSYRFDSYRLSLFRRFDPDGPWSLRAGVTAKVRDAAIQVTGAGQDAERDDLGLVPLLYGGARWEGSGPLAFDAELDALAGPQGRAIDLALRLEWRASDRLRPYLAYRLLDGGADNDDVLSFATFHYALAGASYRF